MVHQLIYPLLSQAVDADGNSVDAAELSFFESGTSTPKTVYTSAALTTAHPSPLAADSSGIWPAIFWDGVALRLEAVDGLSAALPGYPIDNVLGVLVTANAAEDVTFDDTVAANIASTNVQDALEEIADEIRPIARGGTGADTAAGALIELGVIAATEATAGLVERATDAEVTTGTDTIRYMSVKQIIDRIAADIAAIVLPTPSETQAGVIEIATQAEVDAETDDERAVTALKLATYVAAQIAANPAADFDFEAAIRGKADIGATALAAMDGDERVLVLLDNDSIRNITISDLISKASSGGAFDLATAPIVYRDTDGVTAGTYTFAGTAADKYFIVSGFSNAALTVRPSSVVETGNIFAGPVQGGDTVTGGVDDFRIIALKLL